MSELRPLRLSTSPALKEKRLVALLGQRPETDPALRAAVEEAQAAGSLALSGIPATPDAVSVLLRARRAVDPGAPLTTGALRSWQAALTGGSGAFRQEELRT